jgi:hypothetical protein
MKRTLHWARRAFVGCVFVLSLGAANGALFDTHDLEIWNVKTGTVTQVKPSGSMREAPIGVGVVTGTWFTLQRRGQWLIARTRDAEGRELVTHTFPLVIEGYSGRSVAVSPDLFHVVYAPYRPRSLRLYDLEYGRDTTLVRDFPGNGIVNFLGFADRACVLLTFRDDPSLSEGRDTLLRVDTEAKTTEAVLKLDRFSSELSTALSGSRRFLAYASGTLRRGEPRWIRVFDLQEKREVAMIEPTGDIYISSVAVRDDGRSVAWLQNTRDAMELMTADTEPHAQPHRLLGPENASGLHLNFVGNDTLTFVRGGTAATRDLSTRKSLLRVDVATGSARVLGESEFNGPVMVLPDLPLLVCAVGY